MPAVAIPSDRRRVSGLIEHGGQSGSDCDEAGRDRAEWRTMAMPRPYRFVIADDEKPVASGLQAQLESLGYDVVAVVNDGQRAVEMCRRALPDAIFLDIEMPGMDGL